MPPLTDNARGALFMMVSMAGFVCNDTMLKLASAELTLFQAIFLRGIMATGLIAALALLRGELFHRVERRNVPILGLRMLGEIGGTICFLTALFNMPIANATAILQAMPLAVTLAAALFLGERVGWRRYGAICAGFAGVLIIVRPGTEGFNAYAFWAVAAVFFMVLRDVTTRQLTRAMPSTFVAFSTALSITLVGGVVSLFQPWGTVTPASLGLLALAAVFLFTGYLFIVLAMRHGEVGFVSPFRYTILIWAIILGMVFFAEMPDAWMLAGSAIVVATGVYTFYRERIRARRTRAAEASPRPELAAPARPPAAQ
ncbi:MAG TPA: DMT family transporter [Thermohalobaculum sp.]|nr:DMT family transporter [Thermohalobaculum sp.]